MRERRHQSGNSNTPRPASARVVAAGSPTTSPVPPRRHGAVTARKPETEMQREIALDTTTKRRIHSARVERPRSSLSVPMPAPGRVLDACSPHVLPQLNVSSVPPSSQVEWAIKVAVPATIGSTHVKPKDLSPPPTAETAPPTTTTSTNLATKPVPDHLKPILKDFSALLRDRYDGKRSLRLAFLNWDRDKDGQLSLQEIRDMIHSLGFTKRLGHQSVEAIVDHVASTPTQSLKYNDFCGYVYGLKQAQPVEEPQTKVSTVTRDTVVKVVDPAKETAQPNDDEIVLSSDRALYPDPDHVVNILRKKYESRQLRQVFRHWDTDKDGCVTLEEVDGNLRRQGIKLPGNQLRELFAKHDANKDGKLVYKEFVEMICGPVTIEHHNPALQAHLREVAKQENKPPDAYRILKNAALDNPLRRIDEEAICAAVQEKLKVFAPRIHDAYTAFDDDHNGNLSYTEFRQGLDILGLRFTEREFLHIAAMVDTDGSGEISFREFNNLFSRRPQHGISPGETVGSGASTGENCDADLTAKQRVTLSKGRFDFSHLTRKAKVPTRFGKTPYPNTKDLLSPTARDEGTQDPHERERFRTETSLYGSGQTPRSHRNHVTTTNSPSTTGTPSLTLGQEEKQRKDANYAKRLERIRASQHEYASLTAPLQDAYETTQQRRAETLHRHQQRYQTSVEDHRPQQPQYAPQIAQRARQPTIPPYINS